MPTRWIVCPVVETVVDGRTYRRPKVATLLDPGRPGKEYKHSSVFADGANWCLSFVRGADLSAVDADAECVHLFEQDAEDADGLADRTLGDLAWSAAKIARVRARLEARGVDTSGYTASTPLRTLLRDLGRRLRGDFPGPLGTWIA